MVYVQWSIFAGFTMLSLFCTQSAGDEDTEHIHIKLHVPEIINRHIHVKTKLMHVYHPTAVMKPYTNDHPIMPPIFAASKDQMLMDEMAAGGPWFPSTGPQWDMASLMQPQLAVGRGKSRKQKQQQHHQLAMNEDDDEERMRKYFTKKMSEQLMLQDALKYPNFAQTQYLTGRNNFDSLFSNMFDMTASSRKH